MTQPVQPQTLWQRIGTWIVAFEEAMDTTEYDILKAKFERLESRLNELEQKVTLIQEDSHN